MNKRTLNILFTDRTLLVLAAAILSVIIFTLTSFLYAGSIRDRNERLEVQLALILSESVDIIRLNKDVTSKEKKTAVRSAGIIPTLEQILKELGLKAMVIKPLGEKKVNEFTEENAELEIKEADLNHIVNMLYMIDTSRTPMKIKTALIKTTFEDPDKFILKLTVSRLSK
ncbi:MAG TPA: hypothetical protein ENH45_00475 [Nitrospirae bacterium]|nr:hypothetical protein BMS3Abin09_00613 [bacterium BMS3Abin09]GBE40446.1 hypothetical protein BMS3Bbin09_00327 [bacterium BMS3Bbin09]HDO67300.1 hypothetical protein [Nitrospirota bacterium]HDZ83668.1 hypothetical protein [Nitrospirota bacterium]HEW81474.1 hypothetical protein [Nitrospirota bacterium]